MFASYKTTLFKIVRLCAFKELLNEHANAFNQIP